MIRSRSLACVALAIFCLAALGAQEVNSRKVGNAFVTEGSLDSTQWGGVGREALKRFGDYKDWAFKWMDGNDPLSAKFSGKLRTLQFAQPDSMLVYYDIDLPWPFRSHGNSALFSVRLEQEADGERIVFSLAQRTFAVSDVVLSLWFDRDTSHPRLDYLLSMRFAWFLNPFISLKSYKNSTQFRIVRVVKNFEEYCAAGGGSR